MGIFPKKIKKRQFDYIAYFAIAIGFLFTIPQITIMWINQSSQNVSLITWAVYLGLSSLWLIYGIERRVKPVIISSSLHIFTNALMVYSIIVFA